jgi:hypothetical protein
LLTRNTLGKIASVTILSLFLLSAISFSLPKVKAQTGENWTVLMSCDDIYAVGSSSNGPGFNAQPQGYTFNTTDKTQGIASYETYGTGISNVVVPLAYSSLTLNLAGADFVDLDIKTSSNVYVSIEIRDYNNPGRAFYSNTYASSDMNWATAVFNIQGNNITSAYFIITIFRTDGQPIYVNSDSPRILMLDNVRIGTSGSSVTPGPTQTYIILTATPFVTPTPFHTPIPTSIYTYPTPTQPPIYAFWTWDPQTLMFVVMVVSFAVILIAVGVYVALGHKHHHKRKR